MGGLPQNLREKNGVKLNHSHKSASDCIGFDVHARLMGYRPDVLDHAVSCHANKASSIHRRLRGMDTCSSCPGSAISMRRLAAIGMLLCRAADAAQVIRGIDQADVREPLREVSQLTPQARVVFLRKKPEVIA